MIREKIIFLSVNPWKYNIESYMHQLMDYTYAITYKNILCSCMHAFPQNITQDKRERGKKAYETFKSPLSSRALNVSLKFFSSIFGKVLHARKNMNTKNKLRIKTMEYLLHKREV